MSYASAVLNAEFVELPGAARTANAAADFLGCEVGQIANSLVFRAQASDAAVLVMSSGAGRVDTEKLSRLVGEPIGKADAGHPHTVFRLTYRELLRITGGTEARISI